MARSDAVRVARGFGVVSGITSREYRRLAAAVAEQTGRVPSFEARGVLQVMLLRFASGRGLPAQAEWAAELGIGERTLSERLRELRECGLVVARRQGSRPASWSVVRETAWAWLRGELDLELSREIGGTTAPLSREISGTTLAHARGLGGGGGVVAADGVAAAAEDDRRLADEAKRCVQVLRANGVPMPYAMQLRLREWLARGMQFEDIEGAATQAALNAAKGFGYVEKILERVHREAVGEQVVDMREYRPVWASGGNE